MSHIGCPCGNDVRQNDLDSVWLFVADSLMDELADSQAFFGLECRAGEKSEVWHCKECDRLIIFDDDRIYVTRYMRRAFGGTPPLGPDVHRGVLYNEMLFCDEVDEYLTEKTDRGEAPDYEFFDVEYACGNPLLTPRIMRKEVFDNPSKSFGNWYRTELSETSLVIFDQNDVAYAHPLKQWLVSPEDMATLARHD
ncbi:hypothetical protein DWW58_01235 [Olsenella sp. AF16-14LB]|jgi:hypothetical protein|uniref:hypothetical protein n=1 Tax=Atopobiaceae TaxID=1643824 RepID=UPI000E4FDB66|nr:MULTISPECIES: hypothetical protein [unclassified Olsenella]RGU52572.1 hypothetical protein DWW58_01235 [Olsenella sp. AF16-14LB]RGU83813.1 hypothetical protein DWW44_01230 [Olsenella sp. AF15-43LB]